MPSLGNYWNFGRFAKHSPIHLAIRQWSSARLMKYFPYTAPWASWRSSNPRQRIFASCRCGSQLAKWSTSSIVPPRLVRPPTLQTISQAWCCPTGNSFKGHMFPCKSWNSLLVIQQCPRASSLVNTPLKR